MNPLFEDDFHAIIPSLEENQYKPLWTVIIPTHNCAEYLSKAIQSVLNQDPGSDKMEIIIVDDFSEKDNPYEVIEKFGSQRIQFVRQTYNVGKSANYATGLKLSKGKLIHILHGDDEVVDGFYRNMETLFVDFPECDAAFCQCNYIDKNSVVIGNTGLEIQHAGVLHNWIEKIAISQRIQPPSMVVKRGVYENLGGYDKRLKYIEDWEMYTRIANFYKIAFYPISLASYRVHENSSSHTSIRKGERIKTIRYVINIVDKYLDANTRKRIKKRRSQAQALYLIRYIPEVIHYNDAIAYIKILTNILCFSASPKTLYYTFYFTFFWKKLHSKAN